jgi:DNA polymerase
MFKVNLTHDFDDSDAVFFDIETRSAADLKHVGGRRYAADPTTEILSLVWYDGTAVNVWQPGNIIDRPVNFMWPTGFDERPVNTWHGAFPADLIASYIDGGAVFVAHNCADFDAHVWAEKLCPVPSRWYDTIHGARAGGYPAGLDELSKRLFGQGKDDGSTILRKLCQWKNGRPVPVQPGYYSVLLRYNVADVLLLEKVYHAVKHYGEPDVIAAHQAVNDRGIAFDSGLARKIVELSATAVDRSGAEIERLTGGELSRDDLRSQPKMKRWLAGKGVRLPNLRRETVKQFCESPGDDQWDTDDAVSPVVFPVLRLRQAALRITGPKLSKALHTVGPDGRLRDLHAYHRAHTGRWAGKGVQVQNLPRSVRGVDIGALTAAYERGELTYEMIEGVCGA